MKPVRILFVLCALLSHTLPGFSQQDNNRSLSLTAGLSVNPFLLAAHSRVEAGPSVSLDYRINKRLETGAILFTRQVINAPNNQHKQISHIKSPYNLETVFAPYFGIGFGEKKFRHTFSLYAGARNDLYKETVKNTAYNIDETYQNNEWNFMASFGYNLKYKLSEKCALSFRVFIPFNRTPLDDVNRYSIEPGVNFKL